jgi:hypothetical protein
MAIVSAMVLGNGTAAFEDGQAGVILMFLKILRELSTGCRSAAR